MAKLSQSGASTWIIDSGACKANGFLLRWLLQRVILFVLFDSLVLSSLFFSSQILISSLPLTPWFFAKFLTNTVLFSLLRELRSISVIWKQNLWLLYVTIRELQRVKSDFQRQNIYSSQMAMYQQLPSKSYMHYRMMDNFSHETLFWFKKGERQTLLSTQLFLG